MGLHPQNLIPPMGPALGDRSLTDEFGGGYPWAGALRCLAAFLPRISVFNNGLTPLRATPQAHSGFNCASAFFSPADYIFLMSFQVYIVTNAPPRRSVNSSSGGFSTWLGTTVSRRQKSSAMGPRCTERLTNRTSLRDTALGKSFHHHCPNRLMPQQLGMRQNPPHAV